MHSEYDCIVVGAGAGGAVTAAQIAAAGHRVLLIERGGWLDYGNNGRRDHLRNQRLSRYGHNAGPPIEGNPRVAVDMNGNERVLRPHEPGYQNNAAAVGGGTAVYGMLAWRFMPQDFRMASIYGRPDGSSLVDWPISYEDLAPYYEQAEHEIGVSGDGEGNRHQGKRGRDYPMPALSPTIQGDVLRRGAEALGISTFVPPQLINSVPRDGRDACMQCGSCVGFSCPSNAKNGTQNTILPKALASGALRASHQRHGCQRRHQRSGQGRRRDPDRGARRRRDARPVRARIVVVSAGAVESARLLLMSRSSPSRRARQRARPCRAESPGPLLSDHLRALRRDRLRSARARRDLATCDFNHGNDGIIGGSMLANDFMWLPIIFWKTVRPDDTPVWGAGAKAFMRDSYRRVAAVKGPVHEIPNPDCRVSLATDVKDRFGLPVARLSGVAHEETVRTATFMLTKSRAWLEASGAIRTWSQKPVARLSGGQHQAGTCRMGSDPRESVTDECGRVWGHDNLFVSDGSLHPTNGGFNPALTIMAMAFRNGQNIARELGGAS